MQPSDFRNEKNLLKMQKAIAVADKIGVDIDRLFNWAMPGSKFWDCHKIATDIRMAMPRPLRCRGLGAGQSSP